MFGDSNFPASAFNNLEGKICQRRIFLYTLRNESFPSNLPKTSQNKAIYNYKSPIENNGVKMVEKHFLWYGAGEGSRTPTPFGLRILSPLRLPFRHSGKC